MVWCSFCKSNNPTERAENGFICCKTCGKVVYQDLYTEEPTFVKGPGGESRLGGSFVRSIQSDYSESLKRSLNNAKDAMERMVVDLEIGGQDSIISQASAFYRMAAERSFTRGRRTDQVAAACLYIACRENEKPYLLIDFSQCLRINVYVLGAVFLQLCKLLRLEEHPIVQKPLDPSLFIHRFANRLLEKYNTEVGLLKRCMEISKTALRIVASMKRDWMQTGRKPSGLCGAAIYISALSHGFKFSKSDIVRVVHICEATLTKRLIEFENTNSGSLTIEEFNKNAEELEKELHSCKLSDVDSERFGAMEVLCVHKGSGKLPFAHGLCRSCYEDFIQLSGGLHGGSDPPAFQCAERERKASASASASASAEKINESNFVFTSHQEKPTGKHVNEMFTNVEASAETNQNVMENEKTKLTQPESIRSAIPEQVTNDAASNMSQKFEDMNTEADESDYLSDIDDVEVNGYLNNEEEIHYKKIIWEEMNKEYLEEQAAKEAAAAAAFKDVSEASDDLRAAHELAAAAAAAVAKLRKERQQKRASEAKNAGPAQTAAEATRQMLTKKRLSSKINYDVLEKLFNCDAPVPDPKKNRVESPHDSDATGKQFSEREHKAVINDHNDELGEGDEDIEEWGAKGAYGHEAYMENDEEAYDYEYDDGYNEY